MLQNTSWMFICFQHWKRGMGGYLSRGKRAELALRKKVGNFHVFHQLLSMIVGMFMRALKRWNVCIYYILPTRHWYIFSSGGDETKSGVSYNVNSNLRTTLCTNAFWMILETSVFSVFFERVLSLKWGQGLLCVQTYRAFKVTMTLAVRDFFVCLSECV